jgi:pimeloyl-ACP methyl ester carboxylesterase
MRTRSGSEVVNQDRRQRLTTTAMRIAAAVAAGAVLATSALAQSAREIRGPSPYLAIRNEPAPKLMVAARNATGADQIEHHIAKIDGTRFHYVTAGTGDPVLLLPGWPESWIAWRKVVPLLVSAGRRVVVLDPRGFGESDKPAGGYDLDTAARDLHGFLEATNLAPPGGIDIFAHDVGTWIAHAHAVNYPADVRRLVLTESNIPGVTAFAGGLPNETANLKSWQFAFNRLNDLPEMLSRDASENTLPGYSRRRAFDPTRSIRPLSTNIRGSILRPEPCALVRHRDPCAICDRKVFLR